MSNFQVKKIALLSLLLISGINFDVNAQEACNPAVQVVLKQKMLSEALVTLAKKNGFMLSFPKALDRKTSINESMPLDKMIKYLTHDFNTLLTHGVSKNCAGKKLTELIIIPSGEDAELITVQATQKPPIEYRVIDDMDAYVNDVMENGRKAGRRLMTPEQKAEFNAAKKKWKKINKGR